MGASNIIDPSVATVSPQGNDGEGSPLPGCTYSDASNPLADRGGSVCQPDELARIRAPEAGQKLFFNIIERPKKFSVYWSLADDDYWIDGGFVSSHRARKYAILKIGHLRTIAGVRFGHDKLGQLAPEDSRAVLSEAAA